MWKLCEIQISVSVKLLLWHSYALLFIAMTAFRLQGQSLVIVTDSSQTWNTYYEHLLKMFADLWFRRADQ